MLPAAETPPDPGEAKAAEVEEAAKSVWRPRRLHVLGFSAIGLLLVVFAAVGVAVTAIPHDAEFGLLQLLPLTYWSGVSLMALSIILAVLTRSGGLVAVTGTLFFGMLGGTPILFEPNPPIWDAYVHLSQALDISFFGRIPTAPDLYVTNWPGSFLLVALLGIVGSLDPLMMLSVFPFLTGGLTFLGLFVFLRLLLPHYAAVGGSIFGSLLNVWAQFHLSPQSLGLFLALLVLATMWDRRITVRAASAVLFAGLVVTHPTSTVLILGILIIDAVLSAVWRLRRRGKVGEAEPTKLFDPNPALTFGAVWLAWLFFQATTSSLVAEEALINRIAFILQVPERTFGFATARTVSNVFEFAPVIRLVALAVFTIIGVGALIWLSRRAETRRVAQFFWAALVSLILFVGIDILAFQGLFVDRAFMLFAVLLPAVSVLAVGTSKLRRPLKGVVLGVLLLSSVASASTLYYQEVFYFVSDKSAAVTEHLQRVEEGSLVLDGQYPIAVWRDPDRRTVWEQQPFYIFFPRPLEEIGTQFTVYALFDTEWELWYRQWFGINIYQFYEADRETYSMIYSNGQIDIHFIAAPRPVDQ